MTRARSTTQGFAPRRELLLAGIARRCRGCDAPAQRVGLTKGEARTYHGFACARYEAWNEDALAARDISEWRQEQGRKS